jgi:hypothetical protein
MERLLLLFRRTFVLIFSALTFSRVDPTPPPGRRHAVTHQLHDCFGSLPIFGSFDVRHFSPLFPF